MMEAEASSSSSSSYYKVKVGKELFFVDRKYTNLLPIGHGGYGYVASADDTQTLNKVAIKKITNLFRDIGDAKRVLRELKLLRHFSSHENIVSILEIICWPPDTLDFADIYIITNLMESDMDRIISSKQPLSDQHFRYFLYQVLRGLKYIHSANVLHRDLKPSNLLVNANCDLTICDFGLARGVEDDEEEELTEYVVTRWYRAPELLCSWPHYDKSVDVWSVGCIFAEMLCGAPFLRGKSPMDQLRIILERIGCEGNPEHLDFIRSSAARDVITDCIHSIREAGPRPALRAYLPQNVDPLALDLLEKMLIFDPAKRISVSKAMAHPYLHELHMSMRHHEPDCEETFDFEFEKRYFGPKRRNIPLPQLQRMMFEEMLFYRPSHQGQKLLAELPPMPRHFSISDEESLLPTPLSAASEVQSSISGAEADDGDFMRISPALGPNSHLPYK